MSTTAERRETDDEGLPRAAEPGERRSEQTGLASASFLGLLVTQLLTATNDNTFRWLVIGIGKQYVAPESFGLVLSVGSACFLLPYLLLAAPAGYLADRFDKRQVVVSCKLAEILLMTAGVVAIAWGSLWMMFVVLGLMGAQSALFSPAKFGSIPEMLRPEKISSANGLMGLTTVVATSLGAALGNVLTDVTGARGQERWWITAGALLGIALVGWCASLLIRRLPIANAGRRFPWDAPQQTVRDLRLLGSYPALLRVALGMVFFWSLGLLAQLNIDQFGAEGGATLQSHIVPLLLSLVVGVGLGSVLAGVWSGGRVELGILPLGAAGLALFSLLLFTVEGRLFDPAGGWTASYLLACLLLLGLGVSAGLFDVPLNAFMQHRSPREQRGSILASANFLVFFGMLLMSGVFFVLRSSWPFETPQTVAGAAALGGTFYLFERHWPADEPLLSAREIFLMCSLLSVPVLVYIVWRIPQASIRFLVWLASLTVYRIRVYGREHLPETRGALIASNHVSWIDGVLYLLTSSRPVRILVWTSDFRSAWSQRLARFWGAILLDPRRPQALRAGLEEARAALRAGELVCVFPEATVTRTGALQPFRPVLLRVAEGTGAVVVPAYLDGLWGSIFSFGRRRASARPRRWPHPIGIHFGPPVAPPLDAARLRLAVQELGAMAVESRTPSKAQLTRHFVRICRQRRRRKLADSTGAELTGPQLLLRTLILRRLLRRHVLDAGERNVGVLLPSSAPGVVVNAALALDRRVAVNLNATVTSDVMNYCLREANIRHVLTSQKVLERFPDLRIDAEVVNLEQLRDKVTTVDKIVAAAAAYATPAGVLERLLKLDQVQPDDELTIIFTSGSTGKPKGVVLTYGNVAHNVEAIEQVVRLTSDDVLIGILPFFHSFGYTVTLWTVLSIDVQGAYHFSPLEPRPIGKLCRQQGGTILLATPTFLRSYVRRCEKEDFATLDVVVAGAEKLPKDVMDAFEQKFGIRPVEGYGTTELAPLVSVNVPPSRARGEPQEGLREGSVGRPVPGVAAKITDLETGEQLGRNQSGMLWITGPNVMKGYLNQPELTAERIQDGWYQTGDVAQVDDDGFIFITGRVSRFSKIGGEMVSHVAVEEAINELLGLGDEGQPLAAVTSRSHPTKGERLVVVHAPLDRSPEDVCRQLRERGLPNIFIPAPDSFVQVEQVPVLPSGKLDLVAIDQAAGRLED